MLKLVFIGSSGVGKDAIASAIQGFAFSKHYTSTPGPSFNFYDLPEKNIRLQLITTPCKKELVRFIPFTTSTADILFYVYDITQQQSYDDLQEWMDLSTAPENALKVIVANKVDLEDRRVVSESDAKKFAEEHDAMYFEVSAKTGADVRDCIQQVTNHYLGEKKEDSAPLEDSDLARKVAKLRSYVGILEGLKNSRPLLKDPTPKMNAIIDLFPPNNLPTKDEITAILEDSHHILLQNRSRLPFSFYTFMNWVRGRTNPLLKGRSCESRTEWKLVKIFNTFPFESEEESLSSVDSSASRH